METMALESPIGNALMVFALEMTAFERVGMRFYFN